MLLGGVIQTLRDFKRGTVVLFCVMLISGLAVFAISITADLMDAAWLDTRTYIPSILAGFTGFLVGVPVALVGLATITGQREDKATLDRVQSLTKVAFNEFRKLVNEFASDERYHAISEQAYEAITWYDKTSEIISRLILSTDVEAFDLGTYDKADLRDEFQALEDIEPKFRDAVNTVVNAVGFRTEDEWSQIVGSWRVLDQYVRLQRLEQGLGWFNTESDSGFRKWMSREVNPLQVFIDSIDRQLYRPDRISSVNTMRNAVDTLHSYIGMEDVDLGQYLLYKGNEFGPDRFCSIFQETRRCSPIHYRPESVYRPYRTGILATFSKGAS